MSSSSSFRCVYVSLSSCVPGLSLSLYIYIYIYIYVYIYIYIYIYVCVCVYIRRPPWGHQAVRDYLTVLLSSYVGCHVYMSLMSLAVLESCLTAYSHQSAVESLTGRPQPPQKTTHRAHSFKSWGCVFSPKRYSLTPRLNMHPGAYHAARS